MNPNWQITCPPISFTQIAQAQSLTAALSQLGDFSVRVTQFGETNEFPDFQDFRLPENQFSRQVILSLNQIDVVHAQSICQPHSVWQEILDCGTMPLGKLLFSGSLKSLERSPIQFRQPENYLLSRRSWFDWQGERLYLVESFLPTIINFQAA
ncbi:chorismate--pyruvate lyase family protein [Neisseriaceae bacterium B1]